MAIHTTIHELTNKPGRAGIATGLVAEQIYRDTHQGLLGRGASGVLYTRPRTMDIANAWTIACAASISALTLNYCLVDIGNTTDNTNRITITHQGAVANDPIQILLYDSANTLFKSYLYNTAIGGNAGADIQHTFVVTWDGSTLLLYVNGRAFTATTLTTDNAGTMTDTSRVASFGSTTAGASILNGFQHHLAVWDKALTANEVASIYQAGMLSHMDFRNPIQDYGSQDSLVHYWHTGEEMFLDTDSLTYIYEDKGSRPLRLGGIASGSTVFGSTFAQTPSSSFGLIGGRNTFAADASLAFKNAANESVGIGNSWTISGLQRRVSTTGATWTMVNIGPSGTNVSEILIQVIGATANEPVRVTLYNSSGVIFKLYEWDLFDTDADGAIALWFYLYHLTWDGTNLKMYRNGAFMEPNRKTTDNAGTMTNNDRIVSIIIDKDGAGVTYRSAHVESAIWDRALTAQEVAACWNGGHVALDYNVNTLGYAAADNLKHWWRFTPSRSIGTPVNAAAVIDEVKSGGINLNGALGSPDKDDIVIADRWTDGPSMWFRNSKAFYSPTALMGVANNWVIDFWWFTQSSGISLGDQCLLDIGAGGPNGIEVTYIDGAPDTLDLKLWDRNGTLFKHYRYNTFITPNSAWRYGMFAWNGSSLTLFLNMAILASSINTTVVDNAGTMTDTPRAIYIGCDQNLSRFVTDSYCPTWRIWGGTSVPAANGINKWPINLAKTGRDLRKNFGAYTSSAFLQHWWQFGRLPTEIGYDFADPSTGKRTLIPINVSQHDIVMFGPA